MFLYLYVYGMIFIKPCWKNAYIKYTVNSYEIGEWNCSWAEPEQEVAENKTMLYISKSL